MKYLLLDENGSLVLEDTDYDKIILKALQISQNTNENLDVVRVIATIKSTKIETYE